MVVYTTFVDVVVVRIAEVLVLGFAVDDGEETQQKLRTFIGWRCGAGERRDGCRVCLVRGPKLGACELMLFVLEGGHRSRDQFALKSGEAPGLCCKLHDALNGDLDGLFLFGGCEMLDCVDNLFYDGGGSCVDALLCAAAGECREKCLLAPYGLFAGALFAYVRAHGSKQRVRLVITTAQTEEERAKDAICYQLRDGVGHISGTYMPGVMN